MCCLYSYSTARNYLCFCQGQNTDSICGLTVVKPRQKATERNLSWSIAFIKSVFTSLLTKNVVTITFLDVFLHWESSLPISRLFLDSKKNANFTELTCTLNSSSQLHCVHIPFFYHFSFARQSITESKKRTSKWKKHWNPIQVEVLCIFSSCCDRGLYITKANELCHLKSVVWKVNNNYGWGKKKTFFNHYGRCKCEIHAQGS